MELNRISQQVETLVAPKPESVAAVTTWLAKNGINVTPATAAGDMVEFTVPIEQANSLLGADYATYVHEDTNTTMVRTLSYTLPAAVHEHVFFVYPTTQYATRFPTVVM